MLRVTYMYRWSERYCVSSTDFHTTSLVDVNWTVTVINKLQLPPKLLMTPRIPPPGMTQIFDGKASESETTRSVKKRNFYLPHLHLAHRLAVIPSEFRRDLLHHKTRFRALSCDVVFEILRSVVLIQHQLVAVKQTDRQTDRRTDTQWEQIPR